MAALYLEPTAPAPHQDWKLEGGDQIQSLLKHLGSDATQENHIGSQKFAPLRRQIRVNS
jgi:hypothetical protein